jgi:FkbM family methyltransferase
VLQRVRNAVKLLTGELSSIHELSSKVDGRTQDSRERLINIEAKVDGVEARVDDAANEDRLRLATIEKMLASIEAKQDGGTHEQRIRLANIEERLDRINANPTPTQISDDPFTCFGGSDDQGFGHLTYSQFGEDLIIANLFWLLGIAKPTYLDVGANHPLRGSNTALFYARGSRGTIVEANPHLMPLWRELRPGDLALNVGVSTEKGELPFYLIDDFSGRNTFKKDYAESFVNNYPDFSVQEVQSIPTLPLNDIVDQHLRGKWPDLLTMDIEGFDYDVINSTNFNGSGPAVLCVESRTGDGKDESSLFVELVRHKGYRPVSQTVANLIAVRDDFAPKLAI